MAEQRPPITPPPDIYSLWLKVPQRAPGIVVELHVTASLSVGQLGPHATPPTPIKGKTNLLMNAYLGIREGTRRLYFSSVVQSSTEDEAEITPPEAKRISNESRTMEVGGTLLRAEPDEQELQHVVSLLTEPTSQEPTGLQIQQITIIGTTAVEQLCAAIEANHQHSDPVALMTHHILRKALHNDPPPSRERIAERPYKTVYTDLL